MRRAIARRLTRASTLVIALGLLAGCTTHAPPPIAPAELQLAREFPFFTTYWAGPDFRGIQLTAADSPRDYDATVGMRVYYGTCGKPSSILSTSGCKLPLEIATVLYHPHTNEGLGARREQVIRGVPAEMFAGGSSIELYTGRLAIDVYAADPRLARAAAEALLPLNRPGAGPRNLPLPRFVGVEPGKKDPVDARIRALADRLRAAATATAARHPRQRG
jgi:hypothetical protein